MFRQPRRRVIFGPVWTTGAIATIWIELESWRTRIIVGDHSQRNDSQTIGANRSKCLYKRSTFPQRSTHSSKVTISTPEPKLLVDDRCELFSRELR